MTAVHDYLSCELLLTSACNMNCTYCIARNMNSATMGLKLGKKAIDMFVFMSGGAKLLEFIFTGGEPLLHFDTFSQLTHYAERAVHGAGMDVGFILKSNGLLLHEEAKNFLVEHDIKAVISIDGHPAVHNRYRKSVSGEPTQHVVARNLKDLLLRGVSCVASFTVHPNQSLNILENVRYLYELGANRIDIGPVYGTVAWNDRDIFRFTNSLQAVAKYMRDVRSQGGNLEVGPLFSESEHVGSILSDQWGCGAGLTKLAFLPNGQIAGCSSLAMLATAFPNLIIGDVDNGLQDSALQGLLQQSQADVRYRPSCQKCETASNCAGGCLAINYAVGTTPFSPPAFYCKTIHSISKAWEIAWGEEITTRVNEGDRTQRISNHRLHRIVAKGGHSS
jgi:uncharacterized protein